MKHELKILPNYYTAVIAGVKRFEVRKNDRDFRVNDMLVLKEFDGENYTGRSCEVFVMYIHEGLGLERHYCVIGFSFLKSH